MAQLVIAAAGAAIGGMIAPGIVAFGMTGASIGWMAGSMLGSAFGPTQKSEGPRLSDLSVSTSSYGTPIPYVAGSPRVAGQIVWASAKREIANTQSAGGKGGGGSEYTTYTYEVDLLILLTDNEIAGIRRIWSNGELIFTAASDAAVDAVYQSYNSTQWGRLTAYTGASSQLPDPDYEAAVGTANAPAYRGRGSVFIKSLQLGGSGQIPNLTFEIAGTGTTASVTKNTVFCSAILRGSSDMDRKYGYQYTSEPTWASFWGDIGASSVHFYSDLPTDSFDSGVLPTGLYAINTGITYIFANLCTAAASIATGTFEFLDISGTVVAAIDVRGSASNVDNYYGPNLSSLTLAAKTMTDAFNSANGILSFEAGGVRFTKAIYAVNNFLIACDGLSIKTVRISNVRVYQTAYSSIGTASVLFKESGSSSLAVYGKSTATIATVVDGLCTRSGMAAGEYSTTALSTITQPVRSMAISQVSSARTVLEMLAQTYHFDAVLSDKIYFKPRATASVATIAYSELGVGVDPNADPLPLTTANELEIPAQMALTYSNVDGDYQTDTQYSDRLLTGQESTSAITVPLGFTASEAKQIVDGNLLDKSVSGLTTKVQLGITRAALEPTDVVVITGDDASTYRMRVVKRTESAGMIDLDCVLDDATVFTQSGTTSGGTATQVTVLAAPTTTLQLLDIPLLRDLDNAPGFYMAVAGSAANWTSCGVYDSVDDLTYTQVTTMSDQTAIGSCTSILGNWTGGNIFDETNTVTVLIASSKTLSSVTWDALLLDQSTNAALIGSELIQYRTATLVSAGVYKLSGLLRGRRGTEWAQTGHTNNERFVSLGTSGLRYLTLQTVDLGSARYYKAASAGQKLSAVASQAITPAGTSLECFSPVDARANRATTDTVLTWTRRTRLSTRLVGTLPISAPLGEAAESYEVEVWDATYTTLKRTLTSTTSTVTYTSANQVTDFGSNQAVLYLKIYQLSAIVGRGYPLTVSV